ncbi:hypothetical protein FRB94_005311 [Tulasnella sp. JGI-2019a]|nr:hypothetical protein FRB94_005311 [Tulasnella sp. JGI-2019a]
MATLSSPDEIQMVVDPDGNYLIEFPYTALFVSKQWKAVALATPMLWTIVRLRQYAEGYGRGQNWGRKVMMHSLLSQGLLLDLRIFLDSSTVAPFLRSPITTNGAFTPSIRSVCMILDETYGSFEGGLAKVTAVLPWLLRDDHWPRSELEELELVGMGMGIDNVRTSVKPWLLLSGILRSITGLRKLLLKDLPIASLTEDRIYDTIWMLMLNPRATASLLTQVRLDAVSRAVLRTIFLVRLPALENLAIRCCREEQHLDDESDVVDLHTTSELVEFRRLQPSHLPSLCNLIIDNVANAIDAAIIVSHAPNLRHLALSSHHVATSLPYITSLDPKRSPRFSTLTTITSKSSAPSLFPDSTGWTAFACGAIKKHVLHNNTLNGLKTVVLECVPSDLGWEDLPDELKSANRAENDGQVRSEMWDMVYQCRDGLKGVGVDVQILSQEELEFDSIWRRMVSESRDALKLTIDR